MRDNDQRHPELGECDYKRGYWLYQDETSENWIAFCKSGSIEEYGDLPRKTFENAKQAFDQHHGKQIAH